MIQISKSLLKRLVAQVGFVHKDFGYVTTDARMKKAFDEETYNALIKELYGQTCGIDPETGETLTYMCDVERFFFGGAWD